MPDNYVKLTRSIQVLSKEGDFVILPAGAVGVLAGPANAPGAALVSFRGWAYSGGGHLGDSARAVEVDIADLAVSLPAYPARREK